MTTLEILALQSIPGYGHSTVRKIVDSVGEDSDISSAEELLNVVNAYEDTRKNPKLKSVEDIKRGLLSAGDLLLACEELGIKVVPYVEKDFPKNLLASCNGKLSADIPLFLFYKGDLSILGKKSIAIIGTSQTTEGGMLLSMYCGERFAKESYNVISGLDFGCNTFAHVGAFHEIKGATTALVNHGLDFIAPEDNLEIAEDILSKGGLLISKYSPGERPNRCSILSTLRLQALLADATLVIQSRVKGSTLYAAQAALKAGKPVFCLNYKELEDGEKAQAVDLLVSEGAVCLDPKKDLVQQIEEAIEKN